MHKGDLLDPNILNHQKEYKLEYKKLLKQLSFGIQEKKLIENLEIPEDAFLPFLFSIKFGGDWSLKTDSVNAMAIKEKITRYNADKMEGYTLEKVFLFLNPRILKKTGRVRRLEKCGNKKDREIVERPFRVKIDAERIINAVLDPVTMKITIKDMQGPLSFEGSGAYGISHEMEHLSGSESKGKFLWEFKYSLEGKEINKQE